MMTECWVWPGATKSGYGVGWDGFKTVRTHRAAYEALVEPIPEGLVLDHLCRNRACYNPSHLEPVTVGENVRRGKALIDSCPAGHPYDEENTRYRSQGWRACRTCDRDRRRAERSTT